MTSFLTPRRAGLLPALLLLALAVGSVQPAAAQCAELPDCALVWSDEFDGTEVDLTKWTFQIGTGTGDGLPPGWGNNELQYYRPENATVADGLLTITAKQEFFLGRNYTSARMRSLGQGDWTFGRMEMRARMPIGQGLWPAFWMLPSDPSIYGTWAASGEVDIVEYLGDEPDRVFGTLHYGGPAPDNVFSGNSYFLSSGTFHDDFHVFAVEWELGVFRWYVDGLLYSTRTNWFSTSGPFPVPFDVDFHLLLNLAVGGNLPGAPDATTMFPQEYVIDYVRVYQVPNQRPVVTITSPTTDDVLTPGEDLTITVSATDDGLIQYVQFLQDNAVLGEVTEPPYELTIPAAAAGCYTLQARARDESGLSAAAEPVEITIGAGCQQAPYKMVPALVPGTIEVEDYDLGGQDVAYNDTDASNNGGGYRLTEGVDVQRTTDVGYGYNMGWTVPGEWIEYTVDVLPGTYDVEVRVASQVTGGTVHLEFDGVDRTGPITFSRTFGWQTWRTSSVEDVTLDGGVQTMRLVVDDGAFNLNRITIPEPSPSEETNGCSTTTANPCQRVGTCWIERSSWYQVVTIDRSGSIDTLGWTSICNLARDAMEQGDCTPDGQSDVTAYLDPTAFAEIPSITGSLACAAGPAGVGAVPNGGDVPGVPLTVSAKANGDLVLSWGASCLSSDNDYVVYEGTLGSFTSHSAVTCGTGGTTSWTLTPATESSYYLVTPSDGVSEGSHGKDGSGAERLPGTTTCFEPSVAECP